METPEKDKEEGWYKPELPKYDWPIAESIHLPEKEEYFSVQRIIELAAGYFEFDAICVDTKQKGKNGRKAKREFKIFGNYATIKKYVNRELEGKPYVKEKKGNRKYCPEIVRDFFDDYTHQKYFLDKSIEGNEAELNRSIEAEKDKGEQIKEAATMEEKEKIEQQLIRLQERQETISERLKALRERKKRLDNSGEKRKELTKEYFNALSKEPGALYDDSPIDLMVEEYKKEILFQVLFDAFVALDEKELRRDIRLLPDTEEAAAIPDIKLQAWKRLQDLRNYYKVKLDLAKVLGKPSKDTPIPKANQAIAWKEEQK